MKNTFLLTTLFFNLLVPNFADGKDTKKDINAAEKILLKLGIDKEKVKLGNSMSWQQSCFNGVTDDDEISYLTFSAVALERISVKDLILEPGKEISICGDAVIHVEMSPEDQGYIVGGYDCRGTVYFSRKGYLCECTLAKDTVIAGVQVDKGSRLILSKGKPSSVIFFKAIDGNPEDLKAIAHDFKDGRLVKSSEYRPSCNYEE